MEKEITLTELQKEVDDWAQQFDPPYFSPLSLLAAMIEEVGEIARVLNAEYGDKKKKDGEYLKDLEEEIGDLFFSLICMSNEEGISLTNAMDRKFDKVLKRDNNRFKRKDEV